MPEAVTLMVSAVAFVTIVAAWWLKHHKDKLHPMEKIIAIVTILLATVMFQAGVLELKGKIIPCNERKPPNTCVVW